jgi:hypothetical protein
MTRIGLRVDTGRCATDVAFHEATLARQCAVPARTRVSSAVVVRTIVPGEIGRAVRRWRGRGRARRHGALALRAAMARIDQGVNARWDPADRALDESRLTRQLTLTAGARVALTVVGRAGIPLEVRGAVGRRAWRWRPGRDVALTLRPAMARIGSRIDARRYAANGALHVTRLARKRTLAALAGVSGAVVGCAHISLKIGRAVRWRSGRRVPRRYVALSADGSPAVIGVRVRINARRSPADVALDLTGLTHENALAAATLVSRPVRGRRRANVSFEVGASVRWRGRGRRAWSDAARTARAAVVWIGRGIDAEEIRCGPALHETGRTAQRARAGVANVT